MRTLFRASRIRTFAAPRTGEWLLVDGRHVERVGIGDPPGADRTVELPGATIVPGLIDAHVHLTGTGVHEQTPGLGECRTAAELLERVRTAVADRVGPMLVHGYDESIWMDRRIPSLAELDAAFDRPVAIVRVDGHASLANTVALREAGVLEREGMDRDDAGEPTGRVVGDANTALQRWFATHLAERDVERLQLAAASLAVSHGVTTVHEMSMVHQRGIRDLEILLGHRSRLPLDVVTYVVTTDLPQAIDLGLPRVGGDLPVDGSIGARTALLSEPYTDGSGPGVSSFSPDQLAEFFHDGHLAGLQVGVHAIGDAAIELVVGTWERVYQALDSRGRRHFRARRHRVEHLEMVTPGLLERAAMLGLAISVQPNFDALWGHPGGLYEQGLGWERARTMNPFRDLVARGLEVGAGSDSPITTIDPMVGLAAFEHHHDPQQRLTRDEAFRLYTSGSARLAHQEDKKGTLEPGKHADLVAYDTDPVEAASLEGLRPILTVSLGREVFAA
ncbi:MAG TPA: amidohydrolase [Actinomycetota bacterium]|nr:amidohydrolase [Actinomycetota bacterium]